MPVKLPKVANYPARLSGPQTNRQGSVLLGVQCEDSIALRHEVLGRSPVAREERAGSKKGDSEPGGSVVSVVSVGMKEAPNTEASKVCGGAVNVSAPLDNLNLCTNTTRRTVHNSQVRCSMLFDCKKETNTAMIWWNQLISINYIYHIILL